ncbi:MAG: hypothetical protein JSR79_08970, partial [Proteobacteria bacterium]|nr:hypothetical protein [Pseudomonadota bacterium]
MIVVVVILLILLAIIASGVIKAKARMHHADDVRAQRDVLNGSNAKPSWIDTKREEEFFKFTVKLAQEKGVPRSFVMKGFMS